MTTACSCSVTHVYGCPGSFAEVLRQIAADERSHRDESLADVERLRAERALCDRRCPPR